MIEHIRTLKETGRFATVNETIPYAGFVGLEACVENNELTTVLRRRPTNIGNTQIPAVHGGVVGALLEHAAIMQLLYELDLPAMPKVINLSIDYLRPCLDRDTFARGVIAREGRRIANVRVSAWQDDPERPVAAAGLHFLVG